MIEVWFSSEKFFGRSIFPNHSSKSAVIIGIRRSLAAPSSHTTWHTDHVPRRFGRLFRLLQAGSVFSESDSGDHCLTIRARPPRFSRRCNAFCPFSLLPLSYRSGLRHAHFPVLLLDIRYYFVNIVNYVPYYSKPTGGKSEWGKSRGYSFQSFISSPDIIKSGFWLRSLKLRLQTNALHNYPAHPFTISAVPFRFLFHHANYSILNVFTKLNIIVFGVERM